MSHLFPYGITLKEGGKIALFPAAEVALRAKEGEYLSLFLVIDSGATISALPKSDASMLGIVAENGMPIVVGGIEGKPIPGWRHTLSIKLGDEEIKIPFMFLDTDDAPRVLGREGIFDRFSIVFEESKRRTGFLTEGARETIDVTKILDAV